MNIGCFQQPKENFATWKSRGCDFVIGPEFGNPERISSKDWCKAASDAGLMVVGNKFLLRDKFVPENLLAWYLDDEPNEPNHATSLSTIVLQKAAFKNLSPVPVWLNLGGDQITSQKGKITQQYIDYSVLADCVLSDWYVKNRQFDRYPISFIGDCCEYLHNCGAKSLGSFIECSWQKLNKASPLGRCPSPDEFECEVMNAVTHGASKIVYFSTRGFIEPGSTDGWPQNYDPTPKEISDRMSLVNMRLKAFADGIPVRANGDVKHIVSLQRDGKTIFTQEI